MRQNQRRPNPPPPTSVEDVMVVNPYPDNLERRQYHWRSYVGGDTANANNTADGYDRDYDDEDHNKNKNSSRA